MTVHCELPLSGAAASFCVAAAAAEMLSAAALEIASITCAQSMSASFCDSPPARRARSSAGSRGTVCASDRRCCVLELVLQMASRCCFIHRSNSRCTRCSPWKSNEADTVERDRDWTSARSGDGLERARNESKRARRAAGDEGGEEEEAEAGATTASEEASKLVGWMESDSDCDPLRCPRCCCA